MQVKQMSEYMQHFYIYTQFFLVFVCQLKMVTSNYSLRLLLIRPSYHFFEQTFSNNCVCVYFAAKAVPQ